jgi:hypothetical protein
MALATLLFGARHRAPGRSLARWLRDLLTTPDALASLRDPGPAFAQGRVLAVYAKQARALGLSLAAFTTHDIEWNGPGENAAAPATLPRTG